MSRPEGADVMRSRRANDTTPEKGSAMIISVLVTAITEPPRHLVSLDGRYARTASRKTRSSRRSASTSAKAPSARSSGGSTGPRTQDLGAEEPRQADDGRHGPHQSTRSTWTATGRRRPSTADGIASELRTTRWASTADGDTNDDIFDKPYRPALADMLVGTEGGPDVSIDRADELGDGHVPRRPRRPGRAELPGASRGARARVTTIDIYAPPYLNIVGTWTRYGMATVKVTVEIVKTSGATSSIVAKRIVKAVLNETPYPGPFGPLQSCDDLHVQRRFAPHWGSITAVGDPEIGNGANNKIPLSLPRDVPPVVQDRPLCTVGTTHVTWNGMHKGAAGTMVGKTIDDPGTGSSIDGTMLKCRRRATHVAGRAAAVSSDCVPTDQDESNKIQQFGGVGCPEFDYDDLEGDRAGSGGPDVHYYAWNNGAAFQENGVGAATDVHGR